MVFYLLRFKVFSYEFGQYFFWCVTNRELPKSIDTDDAVYVNKSAEPGQIKKARLVCKGEVGRVKCGWVLESQE